MDEYIKAATMLAEAAEKHGLIDKLKLLFSKRQKVLVLGCSGTGKTSVINSLTSDFVATIDYLNRTQAAKKYKLKLDGKKFDFIDTPGQDLHDSRRITAIREALNGGHLGVINVVSGGYHEHATGAQDAFEQDGSVSTKYLDEFRAKEASNLVEWIDLLGNRVNTSWIVTLVNKADLWWDKEEEVVPYYKDPSSDYAKKLDIDKGITRITLEYSSVMHKFYSRGLLSPSFDQDLQSRLRARLVKTLVEISK